jgi:hypothetical protein
MTFTAVFMPVPEGYIGFVEEIPGANSQGETLDELIAKEEARGDTPEKTERAARRRNLPLVSVFADDGDEDEDDEKPCLICEL